MAVDAVLARQPQKCAGQGDLSNPLLAGHDQLLEGQNV